MLGFASLAFFIRSYIRRTRVDEEKTGILIRYDAEQDHLIEKRVHSVSVELNGQRTLIKQDENEEVIITRLSEVVKWHINVHQTKVKVEHTLDSDPVDPLPQTSLKTIRSSNQSVEYSDGSFASVKCFGPFRSIEAKASTLLNS